VEKIPALYKDLPALEMSSVYVSDEVYAQAIEAFIVVCADTLIINRTNKTFYLAKRKAKPCANWYMIGGRMRRGEREAQAAQKNFNRETGLSLAEERFTFWGLRRFWWKDRQQEPQDKGVDTLNYNFIVELTPEELQSAALHLDPKEYEQELGFKEFTRDDLISHSVHPVIVDIYTDCFNP
jgi:ADP-ribose pyrophosphatase YjhB (NUDIX family)